MSDGLTIMSFTQDCGSYLWWWWPLGCLWLRGRRWRGERRGKRKKITLVYVYDVWGLLISKGTFSKATSVAPKGLLLFSRQLFQKSQPTTVFSKVTTQSNTPLYPKHDHLPSSSLVCCFFVLVNIFELYDLRLSYYPVSNNRFSYDSSLKWIFVFILVISLITV